MSFIFRPGDASRGVQLGGKASALLALGEQDLSIPEWFVVLPGAFDASVEPSHLSEIEVAAAVMSELNAALANLCPKGEWVAVRSSALDEDGHQHSFAGQLESFLAVPPEAVAEKVAAVWASAFSVRVRAYREQHQLPAAPRPPAVLIQRMIHADVAGVAFGADPITGQQDIAVVSAVHGLGDTLVMVRAMRTPGALMVVGKLSNASLPVRVSRSTTHRFSRWSNWCVERGSISGDRKTSSGRWKTIVFICCNRVRLPRWPAGAN